ncbi:unnamed protein product [Peronospora belbahrii]|uniref:Uncharacterized protein n=1 Tax=Peronospora belbahrii TaxID=622444 RepID=A0AAU9KZN3_9STRA|nr:unnamed protein product [Peronospora belbahrii]
MPKAECVLSSRRSGVLAFTGWSRNTAQGPEPRAYAVTSARSPADPQSVVNPIRSLYTTAASLGTSR